MGNACFDLLVETQKAAVALSLHKAGVKPLPACYSDDREELVTFKDGTEDWCPVLEGYRVWTSSTTTGWGSWAEVHVSPDMKRLYVIADEFQPWGTGGDVSVRVATYSALELMKAIQQAIHVANSQFSLQGICENLETGKYEWFVSLPQLATV